MAVNSGLMIPGWRRVKEGNAKEAVLLSSWKCWVVLPSARGKEFMLPSPGLGSSSPRAMQANKLQFHQVDERSQSSTNLTQEPRMPGFLPHNPGQEPGDGHL